MASDNGLQFLVDSPGQLSPIAALADIPEEEIWLQKQKSAPPRNLAAVLDFFHFQQLGWK